jgi:glutamate synthase domain-containing protein 2
LFSLVAFGLGWIALLVSSTLVGLGLDVHDLRQARHAVLRNYPIIGNLRFLLEFIRPEIRQYFIEGDREATPFPRAQRSLVYQRAKGEPDNWPFRTQLDVAAQGYEWVNHSMAPTRVASEDFQVWIGGAPGKPSTSKNPCTQPYQASVFNISAMSLSALSANAILALDQGAKLGGFAHDTSEGSISVHHRVHGGDLILQVTPGALLGPLDAQANVFRLYWPQASANSFRLHDDAAAEALKSPGGDPSAAAPGQPAVLPAAAPLPPPIAID